MRPMIKSGIFRIKIRRPVLTGINLLRMMAIPEMPPVEMLFGLRKSAMPAARHRHPIVMAT